MKKLIKGLIIAGVIMVFSGAGISVFAGVAGGVSLLDYHVLRPLERAVNRATYGHNRWGDIFFSRYDDNYDYDDDDNYDKDDYDNNYGYTDDYSYGMISPKEEMAVAASYRDVKSLELDIEHAAVKVVENPELDNEIRFLIKEKKGTGLSHRTGNSKEEVSVTYHSSKNRVYAEGIVEIPSGYKFDVVEVDAAAGELFISAITAGALEMDASAGSIKVENFEADTLKTSMQAGEIRAKGAVHNSVEAEAEAGIISLSIKGSESDFKYMIECALGSIKIGTSEYAGIKSEKVVNESGLKKAELDCSVGTIEFTFY